MRIRLRTSLALLTAQVASIADAFAADDPTGIDHYRDLLAGGPDSAPSYQATTLQRRALLDFLDGAPPPDDCCPLDVGVLGASARLSSAIAERATVSPARRAPGPPPTLRIAPGHRQAPRPPQRPNSLQAKHVRGVVGELGPGEFVYLDVERDEPAGVFNIAGITTGRIDSNIVLDDMMFRSTLTPGLEQGGSSIRGFMSGDGQVAADDTPLGFMRPLEHGATGNSVYVLQSLLIEHGIFQDRPHNRDGEFENGTRDGVTRFQQQRGLPITGKVDRATWHKLARID